MARDYDAMSFGEIKTLIEVETGFVAYEAQPGEQQVWYGLKDNFEDFTEMVKPLLLKTGTMAYLMDTQDTKLYSAFTGEWY